MIIRCPKCKTGYNVPEAVLKPDGRTVRCKNCGHTWLAQAEITPTEKPEIADSLAPVAPHMSEESISDSVAQEEKGVRRERLVFASIIIGIFGILVILLAVFKETLSHMPGLRNIYATIGVEVNQNSIKGIEIPAESVERTLQEDEPTTLTFTGEVTNTNAYPIATPKIIVSLHDEKGIELDRWPAYVGKSELKAGETSVWVCRFFNPKLEQIQEHRIQILP